MPEKQFTHGSLFSGILSGGFDLGFERAGFETIWQVELDPYCRKVLEKNFPHAKRYSDIRDCHDLPGVDVISGGFPCQDISQAGKRIGIGGERSGLWSEMWRIIREVRPCFVVVENVAALLGRGMERVLGDLAEGGYDAEWDVLPASAFGAPHIRERVFILAYPKHEGSSPKRRVGATWKTGAGSTGAPSHVADTNERQRIAGDSKAGNGRTISSQGQEWKFRGSNGWQDVADSSRELFDRGGNTGKRRRFEDSNRRQDVADSNSQSLGRITEPWSQCGHWAVEPRLDRVAHGIPNRVDRLKGLGNAVVPQIAQWLAERIKQIDGTT